MADLTWAEVVGMDAALSTVSATAQAFILAHVNESLAAAPFGGATAGKFLLARVLMAAHYGRRALDLAAAAASGTTGAVVSESVGGISATYAVAAVAGGTASYGLTVFGTDYLEIVRSSAARAGLTV